MSDVFSGASSSSTVTLANEYISVVVCIISELLQPGFDIKLFTKLLVSTFIPFPASVLHQLLGSCRSFKVVTLLMCPCFAVLSWPGFLVVHVALLYPVWIFYPCDQKYLVGSHGGFSSLFGFAAAGVPAVSFLASLMSFRFCTLRLAMESVKVLLVMKKISTV